MVALGSSASSDSLGAMLALTNDGFRSHLDLRDASRDGGGSTLTNSSICFSVQSLCPQLKILEAVPVGNYSVFLTNAGLFYAAQATATVSKMAQYAQFARATTGIQSVDDTTTINQNQVWLSATVDCFASSDTFIFVASGSTQSSSPATLAFTSLAGLAANSWRPAITPAQFGFDSSYFFLGASWRASAAVFVFLIGQADPSCAAQLCGKNVVAISVPDGGGSLGGAVLFRFPSGFSAVGIGAHANGLDLYAFGTELWQSVDGGSNWVRLTSLDQSAGSTAIWRFRSSQVSDVFGVLSTDYTIYIGKATSRVLIPSPSVKRGARYKLADLGFDSVGLPILLEYDYTSTYPAEATNYPRGLLASPDGTIRDSSNSFVKIFSTPDAGLARVADFSFPASLAYVPVGMTAVQLYAFAPDGSTQTFKSAHVGMVIKPALGGEIVLSAISSSGQVAEGNARTSPVPVPVSSSPSLSFDLTVTGATTLADISSYAISEPVTTTVTLSLSSQAVPAPTGGWLQSDVGESVLANFGVYLITAVSSATSASALLVRAPLSLDVSAAGTWQLYDLRAFSEYAQTPDQSLSVGSASAGVATVTISAGLLTFSSSDTWGVIVDVTSSTTASVSFFVTPQSTSYGVGSWSIFAAADSLPPKTFPSFAFRKRPWALSIDKCPWLDTAQNLASPPKIAYLNINDSISAFISLQAQSASVVSSVKISAIESRPDVVGLALATSSNSTNGIVMLNATAMDSGAKYNYRPPSSLGVAVPTTANVYNAWPEAPMYNSRFRASRGTAVLKMCAGAANRAACGCGSDLAASPLVQFSDCISTVPTVLYDKSFVPRIQLYQKTAPSSFMGTYTLAELNNRTDYCISSQGGVCGNSSVAMNASSGDFITWQGPELYHFRLTVVGSEYCTLTAEVVVYVIQMPPRNSTLFVVMSLSAAAFAVLLLAAYVLYSYKKANA
ncbi:hypothetical protein HK405_005502, partial [Cladochytrium tenue]